MIRYKYNLNIDSEEVNSDLTQRVVMDHFAVCVADSIKDYHAVSVSFDRVLDMSVVQAYPLNIWQALEKVLLEDEVVVGERFLEWERLEKSNRTVYLVREYGGNTISQPATVSEELASQKFKIIK